MLPPVPRPPVVAPPAIAAVRRGTPEVSATWLPLLLSLAGLPLVFLLFRDHLPGRDLYIRAPGGAIEAYFGMDFVNMWIGAKLALTRDVAPLFDLHAYQSVLKQTFGPDLPSFFWSYPPSLLLVIAPLGALAYVPALAAWTATTTAVFVAAAMPARGGPARWPLALALTIAPATLVNAVSGQNGCLTAALLVGGLRLMTSRPIVAGVLLGLLTIKPQLGLILPFVLIALGAWRTIAAAVVTTAALVGASLLIFGLDAWSRFILVIAPFQSALMAPSDLTYASMIPSVFHAARRLGTGLAPSVAIQAIAAAAALATTLWVLKRTRDSATRLLAIVATVFLSTPYAMYYDLTSLNAALVLYIARHPSLTPVRFAVLALAWIASPLTRILDVAGFPAIPFILAAVLVLTVRQAADMAAAGSPPGQGDGHADPFLQEQTACRTAHAGCGPAPLSVRRVTG